MIPSACPFDKDLPQLQALKSPLKLCHINSEWPGRNLVLHRPQLWSWFALVSNLNARSRNRKPEDSLVETKIWIAYSGNRPLTFSFLVKLTLSIVKFDIQQAEGYLQPLINILQRSCTGFSYPPLWTLSFRNNATHACHISTHFLCLTLFSRTKYWKVWYYLNTKMMDP